MKMGSLIWGKLLKENSRCGLHTQLCCSIWSALIVIYLSRYSGAIFEMRSADSLNGLMKRKAVLRAGF